MGGFLSSEDKRHDYIVDSIQESFKDHEKFLDVIEKTNKLLKDQLLPRKETPKTHDAAISEADESTIDRKTLLNIQEIQILHSEIVKTNFNHLKRCLFDAIENCDTKHLSSKWKKLLCELDPRSGNSHSKHLVKADQTSSEGIEGELAKLHARIGHLAEKVKSYEINHENANNNWKLSEENEDLKKRLRKVEIDLKWANDNLKDIESKDRRIRELENKEQLLQTRIRELDHMKTSLEIRINALEQRNTNLETQNKRLQAEIKWIKEKPKVPIQLYFVRNDNLMTSVVNELNAMLRTHPSLMGVNLEIQQCTKPDDVAAGSIVLTLCINASRLGTDAASAISGIKGTNKMALLVFHHKDMHAIPTQRSERMLTGAEFRNLGGIYDLVFLQGKGIYACDYNNKALDNIAAFIKG